MNECKQQLLLRFLIDITDKANNVFNNYARARMVVNDSQFIMLNFLNASPKIPVISFLMIFIIAN